MNDDFQPQDDQAFDAFLNSLESEESENLFDPSQVVTIRSTGGGEHVVPITDPMPIRDVLHQAGLLASAQIEYWVDGNAVASDFVVAPGATVTAIGVVKGG